MFNSKCFQLPPVSRKFYWIIDCLLRWDQRPAHPIGWPSRALRTTADLCRAAAPSARIGCAATRSPARSARPATRSSPWWDPSAWASTLTDSKPTCPNLPAPDCWPSPPSTTIADSVSVTSNSLALLNWILNAGSTIVSNGQPRLLIVWHNISINYAMTILMYFNIIKIKFREKSRKKEIRNKS